MEPRAQEYIDNPWQCETRVLKFPEGPSTQYLRTLVPNTIPLVDFGTRVLKYWVLGPSGIHSTSARIESRELTHVSTAVTRGNVGNKTSKGKIKVQQHLNVGIKRCDPVRNS